MKWFLVLVMTMVISASAATTVDEGSFGTIYEVFKMWVGGSLGLTIALLGPIGFILATMFRLTFNTVALSPGFYFFVIVMPMIVGGVVGIAESMMGLGRNSFG